MELCLWGRKHRGRGWIRVGGRDDFGEADRLEQVEKMVGAGDGEDGKVV